MSNKKSRPRLVPGRRQAKSPINIITAARTVCNASAMIAYNVALAIMCLCCVVLWAVSYGICAGLALWQEVHDDAMEKRL